MIKTKSQILLEGRYDSFTKTIVNDLMSEIKGTELTKDSFFFDLPYDKTGEEYYTHESGLKINLELVVNRTNEDIIYGEKNIPYYIKTYIADDDTLVIEMIIDNSYGQKYYEEIFYKLNEDVRHEIEHYLQNIFTDRQQPLIPNTAEYESTYSHHMDPSEIEALVQGFYRRSKIEKKPLDVVMMDDLNKDIELGNLTQKESEDLLNKWINYARRRLPHAIYSK